MDAQAFDRWTALIGKRQGLRKTFGRRATLGLLGGAALAGVFSPRAARGAQRSDRDFDGLFDDDETDVYGTNPDIYDTDGDGSGDGEEIYYGTDPLSASSYAEVVGNSDLGLADPAAPSNTIDVAPAPCPGPGYACNYDTECCGPNVRCCWDGVSLRTECTDVSAYGGNCPY